MTNDSNSAQARLAELARGMAAHNPDAAAYIAEELAKQSRIARVGGLGHGIVLRRNQLNGAIEVRGGMLADYVEGEPPGEGYAEEVFPLAEGGGGASVSRETA